MQKQLYKFPKTDWVVTVKNKEGGIKYFYALSLKEAKAWAEKKKGKVQIFKTSYEFKSAKIQE